MRAAVVWVLVALYAAGALFEVATVGRKREPVTPSAAAVSVAGYAALIVGVLFVAGWIGR